MCARFTLRSSSQAIADLFELDEVPELPARYNIAPSQDVVAVLETREGKREAHMLRWGLVPFWAKYMSIGNKLINAKSETADEKPAFKEAFARRRCLIPADGFYEWKEVQEEEPDLFGELHPTDKKHKQPYHITRRDGHPFAFAGLFERWKDPSGKLLESCTILTTEPNELIRPLHDRMPVILEPADFELWLDREVREPEMLKSLMHPMSEELMQAVPVNPAVGNPAVEGPECIEPV